MTNPGVLDAVNQRLLAELQDNARFSLAELGRRVGLTAPAVRERLQRLEESGIVWGYHAELNPRALGYALSAVIRIRPVAHELPRVADVARQTPEVVECHRITGEDCFFMKVHLRDIAHLEQVVDRFTPLGQTTTSLIQSSPVTARGLALDLPDAPAHPPGRARAAGSGRNAGAGKTAQTGGSGGLTAALSARVGVTDRARPDRRIRSA
jgi:Lrp/AsnC family leucine-responsive transcriptional regulator